MDTQKNRRTMTVLLSTQNICLNNFMSKIFVYLARCIIVFVTRKKGHILQVQQRFILYNVVDLICDENVESGLSYKCNQDVNGNY